MPRNVSDRRQNIIQNQETTPLHAAQADIERKFPSNGREYLYLLTHGLQCTPTCKAAEPLLFLRNTASDASPDHVFAGRR